MSEFRISLIPLIGVPIVVGLLGVFAFMAFIAHEKKLAEENRKLLPSLEQDLSIIPILPGDRFVDDFKACKSRSVLFGKSFSSSQKWETLQDYYSRELIRLGWHQTHFENVKEWGKDFGGKLVRFKKDNKVLEFFFSGADRHSYSLAISIGLY